MDEYVIYTVLALLITLVLGLLTYLKSSKRPNALATDGADDNEVPVEGARPRGLVGETGAAGVGPRNRAVANRNARARMRVAQAQRQTQQQPSDSEGEIEELGDEIALPDGKIGKKKLAKLQMKAEKRAMREAEEKDREEKKEKQEIESEKRRQEEKELEAEEARKEEEEKMRREEEEKRAQEEYEKMKAQFQVDEEGFDDNEEELNKRELLKEFVQYIQNNKVVVLEELAALFNLKTQVVIDRIATLQKNGTLTGVIDDRGKFIFISREELENVAKFIRQRGRISIVDLAEASNTLINLNREATVEA